MAEQIASVTRFDPVESHLEPPAAGHRDRELEWRRTHPEALCNFAGQWVVLEGDAIVAHDTDPQQTVSEARAKGIKVPYIFYVGKPISLSPVTLEW